MPAFYLCAGYVGPMGEKEKGKVSKSNKAKGLKAFHLFATIVWFLLIPPSIILWRDSVPWLVMMSAWANFAAHFSAWQASRAENNQNQNENQNENENENTKGNDG